MNIVMVKKYIFIQMINEYLMFIGPKKIINQKMLKQHLKHYLILLQRMKKLHTCSKMLLIVIIMMPYKHSY